MKTNGHFMGNRKGKPLHKNEDNEKGQTLKSGTSRGELQQSQNDDVLGLFDSETEENASRNVDRLSGATRQDANTEESDTRNKVDKEAAKSLLRVLEDVVDTDHLQKVENIIQQGVPVTYDQGVNVIHKGEQATGMYIVLNGEVEVVTEGGECVITTLSEGEVFGEVSVLFNKTCTARVRTTTECTVMFLNKLCFKDMLPSVKVDLLDWFVKMKYLPTSDQLDAGRIYRRMTLHYLTQVPLFHDWDDGLLKSLILLLENNCIILYQKRSSIVIENDPLNCFHVIIRGRVSVRRGPRVLTEIDCTSSPFTFGEMGLLSDSSVAAVTIHTLSSCQVITIPQKLIQTLVDKFSDLETHLEERRQKWLETAKKWQKVYNKYQPDLQAEVLSYAVRRNLLPDCTQDEMLHSVFQSSITEHDEGDIVCHQRHLEHFWAIHVVRGEIQCQNTNGSILEFQEGQSIECAKVKKTAKSFIATSPALIMKIPETRTGKELE